MLFKLNIQINYHYYNLLVNSRILVNVSQREIPEIYISGRRTYKDDPVRYYVYKGPKYVI